ASKAVNGWQRALGTDDPGEKGQQDPHSATICPTFHISCPSPPQTFSKETHVKHGGVPGVRGRTPDLGGFQAKSLQIAMLGLHKELPLLQGPDPAQTFCSKAAVQYPSKESAGRKGPMPHLAPGRPELTLVSGPSEAAGFLCRGWEGLEEWPVGCGFSDAPTTRPSLLLGSWVGTLPTHSNSQKDKTLLQQSQGAQFSFWGPSALDIAQPLLQSQARGQLPPFASSSHCGSAKQGQVQVSRGRSATGPRVHKLLLECNCI
ncbi:hypothetical protein E2I00_007302, partial [Balaenoptera physalus]